MDKTTQRACLKIARALVPPEYRVAHSSKYHSGSQEEDDGFEAGIYKRDYKGSLFFREALLCFFLQKRMVVVATDRWKWISLDDQDAVPKIRNHLKKFLKKRERRKNGS